MSLKESLQTKVIVALVAITTLIVGLFSVSDYQASKEKGLADLDSAGRLIAERLAQSLIPAMWDFDSGLADKLIQSEMGEKNLWAVLVSDSRGKVFTGKIKSDYGIDTLTEEPVGQFQAHSLPIVRQGKEIGQARIYMTSSFIEQELAHSVRSIFLKTTITDVVLVVSLFLLIRFLLIKPLSRIEAFAGQVGQGNLESVISGTFHGELGALKRSIERMVANLKQTIHEVGQKEREAAESARRAEKALEDADRARERADRSRREGCSMRPIASAPWCRVSRRRPLNWTHRWSRSPGTRCSSRSAPT